jgi:prepilin-type processing-associated H-X9-DG protein
MRIKAALLIAALATCAAPRAAAQTTLVPDPPQFVTGPDSAEMSWSPGGAYLLAVRAQARRWDFDHAGPVTFSVVLWDQARREAKWLLNTQDYISGIHWIARTNVAFIRMPAFDTNGTTQFWRMDARTGAVRMVESIPGDADLSASPTRPLAAVYGRNESRGYVRTLSPAGELGPTVALNEENAIPMGWSADGSTLYFLDFPKPVAPPAPPDDPSTPHGPPMPAASAPETVRSYPAFSPATGALTTVSERPKTSGASVPAAPFTVSTTTVKTLDGPRGSSPESVPWSPDLHPLWLEQPGDPVFRRLFLAPDADAYLVSPRNDAVAYQNGEGVFVIPLIAVPTATLKKARDEAQIAELLNDGKQIALAAVIWGQDHDNSFPAAGSDLGALISDSLKDPAILNGNGGFQYTFDGGPMANVERPSETPLGYYNGPGGRAYVFVDGHVKWVPNP